MSVHLLCASTFVIIIIVCLILVYTILTMINLTHTHTAALYGDYDDSETLMNK